MRLQKTAAVLFILVISYVILYYGRDVIIPMVIALFIWFLIKETRILFKRIPFIGPKIPRFLANILAAGSMFLLMGFVVSLITHNIQVLNSKRSQYQDTIAQMTDQIGQIFNVDLSTKINEYMGGLNFNEILGTILGSVTDLFSNAFTIMLYVLFILLEESFFPIKLKGLFKKVSDFENTNEVLAKIEHSIGSYISIKTLVSLLTGIVSLIALVLLKVDAPIFWAFLIFLLNYIPTIGSLIATSFPAIFALMQFGSYVPALAVLLIVGSIQVVVGNIIEPKVMSNSLNISSLVVLIALSFWGVLWGVTGMFLSIPIMVVIMIILSEFESTKTIAILLSEKGEVDRK